MTLSMYLSETGRGQRSYQPAISDQLLEQEGMAELIKYAGGLKANALRSTIQVKRI